MPKVVFKEDFFDGSKRYKADGTAYDVPDHVVLPSRDISSIDGEPFVHQVKNIEPKAAAEVKKKRRATKPLEVK